MNSVLKALKYVVASPKVTIYRGENTASENYRKGGIGYWSFDPEYAVQFTQTGRDSEVMKKSIDMKNVYDATKFDKELPSAMNKQDWDGAMEATKEKGLYGFMLSEGYGESNSIYVIDKKIFR